ncbi:hypothetical protein IEO21_02165 [Rhodonia placenta]|uniref:Uncharacterized protein n=2 Tax=Rhodonia placenta TaxID=104341 RepID=A0A1X6N4R9_9APHY|nr:hypothetical protein POSPLADRAFT_1039550 [Postia placenta MAD-698-R-SB12]KAF9819422.1 hypothetical protein IEO21_02165 [Postia placenta]OSX63476.1 hypothetical protein POSPLADRAFT_1039550 [Postia placenta MAD-698-R-SB12]
MAAGKYSMFQLGRAHLLLGQQDSYSRFTMSTRRDSRPSLVQTSTELNCRRPSAH